MSMSDGKKCGAAGMASKRRGSRGRKKEGRRKRVREIQWREGDRLETEKVKARKSKRGSLGEVGGEVNTKKRELYVIGFY